MWRKARKKPVVIEFRAVIGKEEVIKTREGELKGYAGEDVIIRGVQGELYPCKKTIFAQTYDILND